MRRWFNVVDRVRGSRLRNQVLVQFRQRRRIGAKGESHINTGLLQHVNAIEQQASQADSLMSGAIVVAAQSMFSH